MKNILKILFAFAVALNACDQSEPDVVPMDTNFPFRMELDVEEGGTLPDEEDYSLEIKFADFIGDLPNELITLEYVIRDEEGDFIDAVEIDEVVYTVEINDCEFERELSFTASTLEITPDDDLGSVPEEFEVVFALPGLDETSGGFIFEITGIQTNANVEFNLSREFEYSVLDNPIAGEWEVELETEEEFLAFQDVFGPVSSELQSLSFADVTGEIKFEFDFSEMTIEIELENPEIEEVCEDGEVEEEEVHLEIEAEYSAEDGGLEMEGSYLVFDDNGVQEAELDFIIEALFEVADGQLQLTFEKVIGEDNFVEGEELFSGQVQISLERD